MNYAVIAISGSQYQVEENEVITVDNLNTKQDDNISTDQVLLLVDDDQVQVGKPLVKNAKVEYKIVKNYKGKKLKIFKYKAKSRYRRTQGFRAQLTDIKITKISLSKPTEIKKPKPKTSKTSK